MSALSNEDYHLARIRQKLKDDGVKLWEAPYYVDNQTNESLFQELAFSFSDVLSLPQETVLASLKNLQLNALEKLSSRSQFQETGLATLKIKLVGSSQAVQSINISLNETGESLRKSVISTMKSTTTLSFKMICHGILIKDHQSLQSQRVANNSKVLVIMLLSDVNQQTAEEEMLKEIELIKNDAELLVTEEDSSYLRIADQSGNVLNLPIEEKKSLAVAMALHEKGRVVLKRNQVSLALAFFYEADFSFTACRAEILNAVDNAGLLNLDIAWCYLILGSAADISDAAIRLESCEQKLVRSYGPRMERLLELKGTTGNEAVLFLRLHLLQGVVAFHHGKSLEAMRIFSMAEEELQRLTINDEDLSHLLNLGYSVKDGRLGLRASGGNLNEACVFLQQRAEAKKERKRKEREEEERNKKRRKLGKTSKGHWVNLGYLETIVEMGFERLRSIEALKKTDNNISSAIQVLQTELEFGTAFGNDFDEAGIAQIVSMGIPLETAREILTSYGGDVDRAIKELQSPNSDTGTPSGSTEPESQMKKDTEAAFARFSKDIPTSNEDHLDTNLELEREYLLKYLSFLKGP